MPCTPSSRLAPGVASARAWPGVSSATAARTRPAGCAGTADDWLTPGRFALLLLLLLVATFPAVVFGNGTFVFRDFGMFSYPVAYFQRQCFWRGELPLWNPLNNCGLPFLAQWNTLALYPFSLIYLVLPLSWALGWFCLAHLFWGGLGMYVLAERWTGQRLAAALAGILFAFNGLALNFVMWPSHIATFSWLPWVLWLGQRAWRQGGTALVWASLAGAMQVLAGGPETIVVTWLILVVLACGDWMREKSLRQTGASNRPLTPALSPSKGERENPRQCCGEGESMPIRKHGECLSFSPAEGERAGVRGLPREPRFAGKGLVPLRLFGMGLIVALLCAVQLLPFLELLVHSQRDSGYSRTAHDWSMPFWGWANFLVPLFRCFPTAEGVFLQNGQYWTSSYYVGIGTVLLAGVAVWRVRGRRVRALAMLVLLGLVLALGDSTLLYRGLQACVPVLGFVRYPVKFVILVVALAPLLGALGLASLAGTGRRLGRFEIGTGLVMLLLTGAIVAWDGKAALPADSWRATWQSGLCRAAFLVLVVLLVAALLGWTGWRRTLAGGLLLGVCWLDLVTHAPTQNPVVKPSVYEPGWVRAQLQLNPEPQLGRSRVMLAPAALRYLRSNPAANLAQTYRRNRLAIRANCNLLDELPQIDGFYSLLPRESSRVAALPYERPEGSYAGLLDFLGVGQVTGPGRALDWAPRASALPLVTAGQQPVFADDRTAFEALGQTNLDSRRTVWLPTEARRSIAATQQPLARVSETSFANQDISFRTDAPGSSMVVIAQSHYPAWKAYVDGQAAVLWRANYGFQALQVPGGSHRVELRYEDTKLLAGAVLSGLGLLVCAGLWGMAQSRAQRHE